MAPARKSSFPRDPEARGMVLSTEALIGHREKVRHRAREEPIHEVTVGPWSSVVC